MLVPKTKSNNMEEIEALLPDDAVSDDLEELSKEEVLGSFERGFRQMRDGTTRPALDFLDDLDYQ